MTTVQETNTNIEWPPKWVLTSIGAICDINPRLNKPSDFGDDTLVSFIPMAAIDEITGTIANPEIRPIGEVWRGYTRFREGDVILAKITPSMENGKAAIANNLMNEIGLGTTEFHVLSPTDPLIAKWIYHYVRQESFRGAAAQVMTGTAGQLRVPTDFLIETEIPLAPYEEIGRIVDEIESQFSRLDTWLAVMQKLRKQLPRLRASIIKAAVEGRLVEQDPDDEPAKILLERILNERRRKWEQDYLADLAAKGKPAPRDDKWKAKYPEPEAPDTDGLPELPEGWVWASLAEIASYEESSIVDGPFGSKLKTSHYTETGARVIRLQNIGDGVFLDEDKAFISFEHCGTLLKHQVFANDLVIAALGDSLPRACIIPEGIEPAIVKADCIRFKPHPEVVFIDYINIALNSETVKAVAAKKIHGIGRPRLNQGEVKSLPVPVAPYSLQLRIAADVAERLSIISRLLKTIEINTKRAKRMRQSILKKAFEGRLVEQDPNDEPASKLLDRIREERQRRAEEEKQKPRQQRERKVSIQTERKALYETLKEAGKPLSARELFEQAGFTHATIDNFYEELRKAVYESKTIRSRPNKDNEVYLEIIG